MRETKLKQLRLSQRGVEMKALSKEQARRSTREDECMCYSRERNEHGNDGCERSGREHAKEQMEG